MLARYVQRSLPVGRPEETTSTEVNGSSVGSFVRRFRSEILAEWRAAAQTLPPAADLPLSTLCDHVPDLLDQIAGAAEALLAGRSDPLLDTAHRHAVDRLDLGFDLGTAIAELSLLRSSILVVWERELPTTTGAELRALNEAVDRAIASSAERYAHVRDRTLSAMDRISSAALEATSIDELLQRLLEVFLESTPAVDTAAILMVEDDLVRTRASVGLQRELDEHLALRIGEGFAGQIAATRQPRELRSAFLDPEVKSRAIRERGVKALYGVPLIEHGDVIAVACMGSLTAHEFSHDDRHVFEAMAARAAIGIHHHLVSAQLAASEERFRTIAHERAETLARLESLLAASPVGMAFLDADLRYERINASLAEMNGHPVEFHLGRTVREAIPELAPVLEPILRHVLDTGEPVHDLQVTDTMAKGDRRITLVNYFPVKAPGGGVLGVGGIIVDVTERERALEAQRTEKARFERIIEHAPLAIYVKDGEGRFVVANQRTADVYGRSREQMIGHTIRDLAPPEVADAIEASDRQAVETGRVVQTELAIPVNDGRRVFLITKFVLPGPSRSICCIASDITDRTQMEDALRRAVQVRDEVLAVVSHDLRGPLGTVQLAAAMLAGQVEDDPRGRKHVGAIQRAVTGMTRLIEDLLDSSTIQAGRLTLQLATESASSLVFEAIAQHEPLAAEKGIQLGHRGGLDGTALRCDRHRLLRVFANLIGNSLKFCKAGDVITVTATARPGEVVFAVADTGPGIDPEVRGTLFEPFRSGPKGLRRGSGLGLYICKGIVEAHGGRIWVDTTMGQGTTFTFTIPRA